MKFSEILSRLTGISTPILGVSWKPPQSDVEVARGVIEYLEDRRVLYAPYEAEVPQHCVDSVLQIRGFLTEQLQQGGVSNELRDNLRAMRASCRKFLESVDVEWIDMRPMATGVGSWVFNQALGEMRGVFGLHIAQVAAGHGLDVPDELAVILPPPPED